MLCITILLETAEVKPGATCIVFAQDTTRSVYVQLYNNAIPSARMRSEVTVVRSVCVSEKPSLDFSALGLSAFRARRLPTSQHPVRMRVTPTDIVEHETGLSQKQRVCMHQGYKQRFCMY